MKSFLIIIFTIFSFNSLALLSERSMSMTRILTENKVPPTGKRQAQEATIICRDSMCTIIVSPPGHALNTVYEELTGERAQELSQVLSEFNIKPQGKHQRQKAEMRCRIPKGKLALPSQCEVVPVEAFRDVLRK